jgi:signal peptidase II
VILVVAAAVFGLDHLTKWLVVRAVPLGHQQPASGPIVLHTVHNSGAAFGLFPQLQSVFLAVAVVVAVYILVAGHRLGGGLLTQVALGAVLGGAAANAIDRAVQGYVVDYVEVHVWPVFNLADSCIVLGIAAVVLSVGPRPVQDAG